MASMYEINERRARRMGGAGMYEEANNDLPSALGRAARGAFPQGAREFEQGLGQATDAARRGDTNAAVRTGFNTGIRTVGGAVLDTQRALDRAVGSAVGMFVPGTRQAQAAQGQAPTTEAAPAQRAQPFRAPDAPSADIGYDISGQGRREFSRQPFGPNIANQGQTAGDRLSALGYSARPVQNAPGVSRLTGRDGRTVYTDDQGDTADWIAGGMRPGVSTVPGDSQAMDRTQRALAIYESMRPQGDGDGPRVGIIGRSEDNNERLSRAIALAERVVPGNSRASLVARSKVLDTLLGDQRGYAGMTTDADIARGREESAMRMLQMREAGDTRRAAMQGQNALMDTDRRGEYGLAETLLRGQTDLARQQAADAGAAERTRMASDQRAQSGQDRLAGVLMGQYQQALSEAATDEERAAVADRFRVLLRDLTGPAQGEEPVGYAEGGVVARYGAAPSAAQALPEVNEYRDYAEGARALGLPAIPFEQFTTLRAGARQVAQAPGPAQPMTAMGFAAGGEIPDPNDVSGKMVVDTDPNAPVDSIPAVVDGQMPARLDSGEFVLPQDVVAYFGTDRLNKMIAQARQGQAPRPAAGNNRGE